MMAFDRKHYRVLHVEDNPLDAELVKERLLAAGHQFQITVADSRAEFDMLFAANQFDLVLADYALPDFDGLSALEIVRAANKHLPFIFISGVLGEDVAVETLVRGATDYVLKQKLDRLVPAVKRALSEYAAYRSRERAEYHLRKVEERFEKLTNSLPAMVWTSDSTGRLIYTNSHWMECVGKAEFLFEKAHVHLADLPHCLRVWEDATAASKPFAIDCRFRVSEERAYHWHIVRATPVTDDNGSQEWVGTCTDIQQQRTRDAELKTAERLALIGRMNSVIAHEINNPLEALMNLHYLIRSDASSSAQAKAYLADAEHELLRISAITKQTLMWSREESSPSNVSAIALFEETLKVFSGKLRNKDIHVVRDFTGHPFVRAVPGEIRQVIANLLSNAIDAVPMKGNIRLGVKERLDFRFVELSVEDDGHGIEQSRLDKLFRPFESTKGNLGNGLGLYVSKGIVDRHEGEMTIRSGSESGTRVSFTLPLAG